MPREKLPIQQCDPLVQKIRSYEKRDNFDPYKIPISRLISEGRTHFEILQWLAQQGVILKPQQLKYHLKRWGLTKTNLKPVQRSFIAKKCREWENYGLPPPSFKLLNGEPVRASQVMRYLKESDLETKNYPGSPGVVVLPLVDRNEGIGHLSVGFGPCVGGNAGAEGHFSGISSSVSEPPELAEHHQLQPELEDSSESLETTFESCENVLKRIEELDSDLQRPLDTEGPKITDGPDKWSEHYRNEYEEWVALGEEVKMTAFDIAWEEMARSGDGDLERCYLRAAKTRFLPESHFRFMKTLAADTNWKTGLIPLRILETFSEKDSMATPFLAPSEALEEARESQQLRQIFNDNFGTMTEIGLYHMADQELLRVQIVHMLSIEEQFGSNHYYLIQTMLHAAGFMERAEQKNDEDIIAWMKLVLQKLERLGAPNIGPRDIPHALAHLTRALVRLNHLDAIIDLGNQYPSIAEEIHKYYNEFEQTRYNMCQGRALIRNGDCARGNEYLLKTFRSLGGRGFRIGGFFETYGCLNTVFDFVHTGKTFNEAGNSKYATVCFHKAIELCQFSPYKISEQMYEAVHELGATYARMKQYRPAILWLEKDFSYRKERFGLDGAGLSIRALVDVMEARGPVLYTRIQPTVEKFLLACEKKRKYDDPIYQDLFFRTMVVNFGEWEQPL
ncbi:hypothetical protein ABW20_dc0106707 [Dactylellina cionopaga]|nr:hypothetical protein ABW20_dc0106707 [Dactylellina cionopaga]